MEKIISSSLLCALIILVFPACASYCCPAYEELNFSCDNSFFFSYLNMSVNEVTNWRDDISEKYYKPPSKDCALRHNSVFIPDIPKDTKLTGYYIMILPDGVSRSYSELIDAGTPVATKDEFLSRAAEWLNNEEVLVTKKINDQLHAEFLSCGGYSELARHTTVRKYQDIGKIISTTIVYQYLNDGDPKREYFCIASYTEMTPEDEFINPAGWKNSKFCINNNFNVKYDSLKPYEVDSSISNPQTSLQYITHRREIFRGLLNIFDIFGLFGHSITLNPTGTDYPDVSWVMECGYFTESASDSLHLVSVSEIMPKQFPADEDGWHILAKTGIDAGSGWSGIGGLLKKPSNSSKWGNYIIIH